MRTILIVVQWNLCLLLCSQLATAQYISTETATKERPALLKQPFIIFPESRDFPLQWNDSLKENWLEKDYSAGKFRLKARPGEYFVYQIGVWAIKNKLDDIKISFSDLKGSNGNAIPSGKSSCFNSGGVSYLGKPFARKVAVQNGRIQPLWCGIDLSGVAAGNYNGRVTVSAAGKVKTVQIELEVAGSPVEDYGYNSGRSLSRMNWLNSTVGINDTVTRGYIPVTRTGNTLRILGRSMDIAANGLPAAISSYFASSNESITTDGAPLLADAFRFVIEKENGEKILLQPGTLEFTESKPDHISWRVKNLSRECELICSGRLEFDGFADYQLAVKAHVPLKIKDIRLEVPVNKEKATYMMGLNREGGIRPSSWQWKWDTTKSQDAVWLGAVNGGLRIKWKAENYQLPLVNIYYHFAPLHLPSSWGNNNQGGISITEKGDTVWVQASSANRKMAAGDVLNYDFELLITPFKPVNKEIKYGDRYLHGGNTNAFSKIESARKAGANIINIHHAEDIYPFINYPYIDENIPDLKRLVNEAHSQNIRLKLYYTSRELTKNAPEFWPFYSLGGEVFYPGPGNASRTEMLHPNGPNEWLIRNVREKYIPAWYNTVKEGRFKGSIDLSIITTPNSRMNNFYIGGLDWMLKNLQIDGVYIDDAALDRFTLRRARKLIDHYRPAGTMDLHSWNHFNKWAGYASCLNLYMDLLPYIDLVWIGEGRDYNRLPDHWLVEVSGIPFGLTGQMLEGGGNPWRGMVYGITTRAAFTANPPDELWKFWDLHRFKEKDLIGYWDKTCPVTTQNEHIKASVFKGEKESIIAIANWSNDDQATPVIIDWNALGYNPSQCLVSIPFIKDFQDQLPLQSLSSIKIPGKKGYLIVLTNSQ